MTDQPPAEQLTMGRFLENVKGKTYQSYAIHLMANFKSSAEAINGANASTAKLPAAMAPLVADFIDEVNGRLARDKSFWETGTCPMAHERIAEAARSTWNSPAFAPALGDQKVQLDLFIIATLNFVYTAYEEPGFRTLSGIGAAPISGRTIYSLLLLAGVLISLWQCAGK